MFLAFNWNERRSKMACGGIGRFETFKGINLKLAGDSCGHLGLR